VSGVGTTVGLVTQSWILGLTSAIVASFLAVAVYYKAMNWLTITVLVLVGVAITFGLTRYASSLLYDQPQVGHFWFFGEQTFWIGRQVDAGVIAGIICGGAAIQRPLWHKEETLFLSVITLAVPFWVIILSLIGYFFNGGFGFGPGWFFLIIGIITSYYSISGLIISLFVFHASNYI
jgi:hypothetical protein